MAMAQPGSVFGQTAAPAPANGKTAIEDVIVTSQKREQKLQKVPQSIQVLDTKTLDRLQVTEFNDYIKFLPSVNAQVGGPNGSSLSMRGVNDGDDGNHSGPLPTIGTYLDEEPVTTIGGTLDIHVYDIARVEVLPGPQGTLYGASSEAGTLRIITNKPDLSGFYGAYDIEGNTVDGGGQGYTAQGFLNIPLTNNAAVRLVAWDQRDAGYIDNVYGTRTFPTSGTTINNAAYAEKNANPADTFGGRAALRIDLDDEWTITPTIMGQDQRNMGSFGYEPSVGDLQVQQFGPNTDHDRWAQGALTVQGKIGDFDLTYAGSVFVRDVHSFSDYTDYSIFYDAIYGSGVNWQGANGQPLADPKQEIDGKDHYNKESNEIRLASPASDRLRFIVGGFQEVQDHRIVQDYQIQGFAPALSIPGWANTIWLTDQMRTDQDEAIFGELAYDVTDKFTVTAGVRPYWYNNSLRGFFGFSENYDALTGFGSGEGATGQNCLAGQSYADAPCVDLNKSVSGSGETHKVNLSYKIDPDKLAYFTYSTGYRPGGINRNANFGGYGADTLTNFELGFKSSWLQHALRFNVALYDEDWNNFQYSFLGPNSLTIIENAPAANIKGLETEMDYRPVKQLTFSGGFTLTDAKLVGNLCNTVGVPCTAATSAAPSGTELPYTPAFKGNITGRYTWDMWGWDGHVQSSLLYQTRNHVGLRTADNQQLGSMPAYATVDLTAGIEKNNLSLELYVKNLFDERGQVNRYTSCTTSICTAIVPGIPQGIYVIPTQPLTVGLRLSQKF
jgi:outer membrane receptor protein involved in Fe transport